eukprot:s1160_g14.t1
MRLEALGARWVDGSCLQQRRGPQTPSHQIRRHRLGHRPKLCTIPLHTSSESCLAKKKLRSASHRVQSLLLMKSVLSLAAGAAKDVAGNKLKQISTIVVVASWKLQSHVYDDEGNTKTTWNLYIRMPII